MGLMGWTKKDKDIGGGDYKYDKLSEILAIYLGNIVVCDYLACRGEAGRQNDSNVLLYVSV